MLVLAVPLGTMFIGGYYALTRHDLWWAPPIAGVLVAAGIFVLAELAYRPVRERQAEGGVS